MKRLISGIVLYLAFLAWLFGIIFNWLPPMNNPTWLDILFAMGGVVVLVISAALIGTGINSFEAKREAK